MAFSDTFASIGNDMDSQRQQMNQTCINNLTTLSTALLAECPTVGAVFWYQSFAGQGFSIDNVAFVSPDQIGLLQIDPSLFMGMGTPVDQGPAALGQFVNFLQTISYHLYCVHGANVVVIMDRTGFRAVALT